MPRWLVPALVVSVLVLLAVAVKPILFPAGNPRLTQENFDRIKEGMSREEAEAILGPPGDYRTGLTQGTPRSGVYFFGYFGYPAEMEWEGDGGNFRLSVNRAGRIVWRDFVPMEPAPVSFFDTLRWRWDHWRESRR
jgi:hypothetical protein